MRKTRPGMERKSSRRRSWFNGSSLFNMFQSAPPSPEYKTQEEAELGSELRQHRSLSLTPMDASIQPVSLSSRPNLLKNKSTFASILSKATKRKHKRNDSSATQDSYSTFFDSSSSLRRSSTKSDATSISERDIQHKPYQKFQHQQQLQQHSMQLLKSDEEEADRIQLKNDLVKLAFEGEFFLPFDYKDLESGRILDVGCGPGSWCIDLSTKYPRIQVIGVDSDDMFPPKRNLPSNCQLMVCNVLNGLKEFPDASFDVIHIRFMVLSLTISQYNQVVKNCWRLLRPGGFLEILETDLTVHSPGPITKRLNEEMHQVSISRDFNPRHQVDILSQIVPNDAVDRQVKYRSIPIGVWGGRIGVLCRDDMINMLTKFQPAVQDFYKRSSETQAIFNQEIQDVIREMDNYKSFSNYYFYTAQKPFSSSPPPQTPPAPLLLKRNYTSSLNPKAL